MQQHNLNQHPRSRTIWYLVTAVSILVVAALGFLLIRNVLGGNNAAPQQAASSPLSPPLPTPSPTPSLPTAIKTVFVIVMENTNWSDVTRTQTPYLANTLVPMGAHAEQYYNPPGNHPSLPNYLWLEAGTNFGITEDGDPATYHQGTTQHLTALLQQKGIPWKAYEEDISGTDCPLENTGRYAVRHDPFAFFDDVTGNGDSQSTYCIQHIRPYSELAADLAHNTVARYNFITPNPCDDTHDCPLRDGDTWLSHEVPAILASQAYRDGGVLFITWDEAETGDGPIGLIALSPFAKAHYANTIHYTHSSLLRTLEEIFGVSPLLGDAANAQDLGDLFTIAFTKNH